MHFGQLRAYSDGARPELIEVNQPVHFKAWFSQRIVSDKSITTGLRYFAKRNETKRNETKRNGTLRNGTLRNSTLRNGILRNGTLRNY